MKAGVVVEMLERGFLIPGARMMPPGPRWWVHWAGRVVEVVQRDDGLWIQLRADASGSGAASGEARPASAAGRAS